MTGELAEEGRSNGSRASRPSDPAPRRRRAPTQRVEDRRPARLGGDLYRGVRSLTRLQADAFVTLDARLAHEVEGIVATAKIDALRTA